MNKTRSCMTIKCPGVFLNLIYTQNEGCIRTQSEQDLQLHVTRIYSKHL